MMYLSDKASNYAVQCCTMLHISGWGQPSQGICLASPYVPYRSCTPRCKTTLDPYKRERGRTKPPSPQIYHTWRSVLWFHPRRGACVLCFCSVPVHRSSVVKCHGQRRSSAATQKRPGPCKKMFWLGVARRFHQHRSAAKM
jgi:hypothetical protein